MKGHNCTGVRYSDRESRTVLERGMLVPRAAITKYCELDGLTMREMYV